MKKIIIIHSNMEIGGAETSLLNFLYALDYSKVSVDLFLYEQSGELLELLPDEVNVLDEVSQYKALMVPIREIFFSKNCLIAVARLLSKLVCYFKRRNYTDYGYIIKQRSHCYALAVLPKIEGKYDCAISYIDPHYIMLHKVNASKKIGWFHTDFKRIRPDKIYEDLMWNKCDYIVNVSDSCKRNFDEAHEKLINKSIVIENLLSKKFIESQANAFSVENEMKNDSIKLLSIGRFSEAKNFDNVPDICKRIIENGIDVKWYLIGYGGEEALIQKKIKEACMEEQVIILGKKSNPYPYIANCDVYIQPSRYEGKSVTVREAQILGRPVIITNYSTAKSQLINGIDGIIVPMDNEGCAKGIVNVLNDARLRKYISTNCRLNDYSNIQELKKLYNLILNGEKTDCDRR